MHEAGKLRFFGEHAALTDAKAFKAWLTPLRKCESVVCAKRPFTGPQAVLAYLSRYTRRVAIDWHAGTITLRHTKGRRVDILPLPVATVGAIARYLELECPKTTNRAIFVRNVAPRDALSARTSSASPSARPTPAPDCHTRVRTCCGTRWPTACLPAALH